MKNFLIVGASSGIGKSLAELMAKQGHRVYATFNKNEQPSNGKISFHYLDVLSDEPDLSFIPQELHGVAYCPGSINLLPFGRIRPRDFINDYELQVVGAVKIIQAVLPALKMGKGSVVFFSSVAVQQGFAFHSQVSATKGGIEGLARALAAELAPGIRVNVVAPSITDTPLASRLLNTEEKRTASAQRHPLKRIGIAADISSMAAFLLSSESGWCTGQVFSVDGGIGRINT